MRLSMRYVSFWLNWKIKHTEVDSKSPMDPQPAFPEAIAGPKAPAATGMFSRSVVVPPSNMKSWSPTMRTSKSDGKSTSPLDTSKSQEKK